MPPPYTPRVDDSRRIQRTPGVLEAEIDGDRVLMHPETFDYFGLSATGVAVWDLIDGSRTRQDVVDLLAQRYDDSPERIDADVAAFLAGMQAAQLVSFGN